MGSITAEERQRQIDLLNAYGLPTTAPEGLELADIQAALAVDKKVAAGRTRWILCDGIGRGRLRDDVSPDVSDEVLKAFWRGSCRDRERADICRHRHSSLYLAAASRAGGRMAAQSATAGWEESPGSMGRVLGNAQALHGVMPRGDG